MKHYIIDGNNLIGKVTSLRQLQKKDKQGSREKLSIMIDNYFHDNKAKVTIHFDGHVQQPIKPNYSKIIYSNNKSADDKIKKQIETCSSRKNLVVVSSDNNVKEFARVCSCSVISSEEFAGNLQSKNTDDENEIIKKLNNEVDEFKKLFGIGDD
jgi:predicted RNA-binding protein with PIN domain